MIEKISEITSESSKSRESERACFPIPLESFFVGTNSEGVSQNDLLSTCKDGSVLTDRKR